MHFLYVSMNLWLSPFFFLLRISPHIVTSHRVVQTNNRKMRSSHPVKWSTMKSTLSTFLTDMLPSRSDLSSSHLTCPFCLSIRILGLTQTSSLRNQRRFVVVSLRWTLGCPSPMCFSTTVPRRSSPSETRVCMVALPSAARLSMVTTKCPLPSHSALCKIGWECAVTTGVAGGHPVLSIKQEQNRFFFFFFALSICPLALQWLGLLHSIEQCCVCVFEL